MRRVIVTLLFIIALVISASAQSSEPAAQVRWGATDPPKCIGGRGFVFYNSISHLLKKCDTTDTWTTIGSGGGGGSGDVVGPGSATDNAVVRFDGPTGKLVQSSPVTITDATGDITAGKYNGITFTPVTATFTLLGSTVITGPSATTTLPGLSLANMFTAKQTITPAANTNALAVSGYSLTGSNTQPMFDLSGTWNVGSATPTAIKLNITNTSSGSNSKLLDLLVNSSSMFSVNKDGAVLAPVFQGTSISVVNTDGSISMSVDPTSAKLSVSGEFEIVQNGGGVGTGSLKINGANFSIGQVPSDAFIDFDVNTSLFRIGVGGRTIKIGDSDGQGNGVLLKVDDQNGFLSLTGASTVFSGDNAATPTASALVSINSTDLGFLPPRMTTTQRDNVSSPAEGLTVFNTTTHVPNYWNGSAWSAGNGAPYTDAVAIIKGSGDTSKLLRIEVDGFTTATTRVLTPPDADTIIPIATQQLTFAGPTAARTITFPDAAITVARTDAANTFTGVQTMTSPSVVTSLVTASTTFALVNTTATTINFAGAATTLNIGASATTILNFGGSTTAAEFRFLEPSGSGTNYSAFKAVAQGANITYSLPPTVGAAGTVLTDAVGNGVLTWAAGGGGGSVAGSDTQVQFNDSSAFGGDAGLTYNKTTNVLTITAGGLVLATSGTITQTSASATALSIGPSGATNPVFQIVANVTSAETGIQIIGRAAGAGATLQVTSSGASEDLQLLPKSSGNVVSGRSFNTSVAGQAYIAGTDNNNYVMGIVGGGSPMLRTHSGGMVAWSSDNSNANNTLALGLSYISSGILGIGTGAQGSIAGSISLTNLITSATSSTGTAAIIDGSNVLRPLTSSLRFKENVREFHPSDAAMNAFLLLDPIRWDYRDGGVRNVVGFSAEGLAGISVDLVNFDKDGLPYSNREHAILAFMHEILRRQQTEITELKTRIH